MSDLGHPQVEKGALEQVVEARCAAPQHTYMLLTKRPSLYCRSRFAVFNRVQNLWCGMTVENMASLWRWQSLDKCALGRTKFVSVEPMLEPVSLAGFARPDWVIAGPETGPRARPCKPEWIERLSRESLVFFDKRKQPLRREFPSGQLLW